jgi:hypothetical protein
MREDLLIKPLDTYRRALDAGADPTVVSGWINQTEAERLRLQRRLAVERSPQAAAAITPDELAALIDSVGEVAAVLDEGDDTDKADLYRRLGLRLTFNPEARIVEAETHVEPERWATDCVEGGDTNHYPTARDHGGRAPVDRDGRSPLGRAMTLLTARRPIGHSSQATVRSRYCALSVPSSGSERADG